MKKFAGGVLIAFSLIGCAEEVKTVQWYKEHPEEMKQYIDKCKDNPGELAATPNCINAKKASASLERAEARKRGGIDFKPLDIDFQGRPRGSSESK